LVGPLDIYNFWKKHIEDCGVFIWRIFQDECLDTLQSSLLRWSQSHKNSNHLPPVLTFVLFQHLCWSHIRYLTWWEDPEDKLIRNLLSALNAEKLKQIPEKQLRPIGKGDQELEKRLDQKELT
jgi:hypothetical protein